LSGGIIQTGKGYRICKLRYEGYPGMWVPALFYEPTRLRGQVPAVLHSNGHHIGGKAVDYKQARCINLAKRGVLALNVEFIGMGELCADADHNRLALLDLCGVAGIGVFYLLMKRGLDVLLSHPRADPARTAMTGLSGGGWQTAIWSNVRRIWRRLQITTY
jgi:cephalosporin-C deacetylase-like acetyl esterase